MKIYCYLRLIFFTCLIKFDYNQKIDYFNILYIIHLFFIMFTLHFDNNYENIVKKVYETKNEDVIILNCKYYTYPDIILNNTPLPKVLANLICKWIDDKITLKISYYGASSISVRSEHTCVNFVNIDIAFNIANINIYSSTKKMNLIDYIVYILAAVSLYQNAKACLLIIPLQNKQLKVQ